MRRPDIAVFIEGEDMRNTDYRGHSIVITTVDRTSECPGTCVVGIYKHGKSIHRDERPFADEDTYEDVSDET